MHALSRVGIILVTLSDASVVHKSLWLSESKASVKSTEQAYKGLALFL